jgi:hypothetical protein
VLHGSSISELVSVLRQSNAGREQLDWEPNGTLDLPN